MNSLNEVTEIKTLAFFDLETTGLPSFENYKTKITEISIVACSLKHFLETLPESVPRVLHKLSLCCNPYKMISLGSTDMTKLDNELLENEKKFDRNTLKLILCFLQQLQQPVCLIAHNGDKFDFPLLKKQFDIFDEIIPPTILCCDSLTVFMQIDDEKNNPPEELLNGTIQTHLMHNDHLVIEAEDDELMLKVFGSDMQKINETTPTRRKCVAMSQHTIPRPIASLSGRQLFASNSPVKKFKEGYTLGTIYKKFKGKYPDQSHYAESDYLEDNVHQTYVDVGEMAKTLQERHREYQRRKVDMFRNQVEQAYKTVLHSYGLDSNPGSDLDDDGSDDLEETRQNSGHMNDALQMMYMKPAVSSTNDGELIDISSDEEGDETPSAGATSKQKVLCTTNNVTITKVGDSSNTNGDKANNDAIPTHSGDKSNRMHRPGQQVYPLKQPIGINDLNKKRRLGSPSDPASSLTKQFKVRRFKKEVLAVESNVNFSDIGGNDKTLKELCELILHIKHPEIYRHIGLPPPRGFLLNGAPGTGKTLLARAIAGQLDVLLVEVPATELIAGVSGESEERIREVFEQAAALAPCVLFIDEIDAISSNRLNASKDMERRIVSQLLNSLDNLSKLPFGDQVLVIGATNRTDALDPALRRVGRFDHEICLGIPDRESRCEILRIISKNLKLELPFDFEEVAKLTPGYVGADLLALCTRAASSAVKRIITQKEHEILLKNLTPKSNQNDVIAIVNIDDDPILMDIDADQDIVNGDATDNKKEEDKSVEKPEVETFVEETKDAVVAKSSDILMDDKVNENEIASETESLIQNLDETIKIPESTEEQPEKEETLAEAVLARSSLKLQLSLENMIKWLNYSNVPLNPTELKNISIQRGDFLDALKYVQPSAKREGFITVPDVTWEDIGSLQDIRDELKLAILAPVKFPQRLKLLGLQSPTGVLLCGPPGCGKTLLAKAVANEAGINFISVKGPELLNMYVGESERAVRQVFQRARNSAPCVIFFDEFDSLCPKRSDTGDSGSSMRVVNQLLTEMDGIEDRKGVFLMAATNRPDIVDPAVMRPGRLDKILYVGLPMAKDRLDILNALTKNGTKPPLAEDVDMQEIADLTEGYTGADLAGLVRQASLQTLKDSILLGNVEDSTTEDLRVYMKHFVDVHKNLKPSVNKEDIKHYNALKEKYGRKETA